jgi:hypothetical protein
MQPHASQPADAASSVNRANTSVPSTPPVTTTFSQLAQAPPNDATHPVVVDRLTKDMRATAVVLDAADAVSMSADEPWKALQQLHSSVDALFVEVEGHRDDAALTHRPTP